MAIRLCVHAMRDEHVVSEELTIRLEQREPAVGRCISFYSFLNGNRNGTWNSQEA